MLWMALAEAAPGLYEAAWTIESDSANANFGWSVVGAGDLDADGYADIAAGAPWVYGGFHTTGVAMAFLGASGTSTPAPAWQVAADAGVGPWINALGASLAAGDLDGDGYGDLIVGAIDQDDYDEGAVSVFHGSAGGLAPEARSEIQLLPWCSYCTRNEFGVAVAAGDVNADGYDDLIVGAPGENSTWGEGGSVHLFYGSADGVYDPFVYVGYDVPNDVVSSPQLDGRFGQSVAAADVNGDGYADLVVGAPQYDAGELDEGRVYVYLGGPDGWSDAPAWFADPAPAGAHFGAAVAAAGDVNGDGYDDILVGAPNETAASVEVGAAYVYLGSAAGPYPDPFWHRAGDQSGATFGAAVAGAGDANGDGFADLIVGSPRTTAPMEFQGKVFVFVGSPYVITPYPAWLVSGAAQEGAGFGAAVAGAGDVDGDGLDDIVVAAPFFDGGEPNEGQVTLFLSTGVVAAFDADGDGFDLTVDCDDADPAVYPRAPEVCDGKDSDCNSVIPPDELDFDQDGALGCGTDCDDGDASRSPDLPEACGDGVDNDCDEADAPCPPEGSDTGTPSEDPPEGCGCASGTAPAGAGAALVLAAIRRRRHRERDRTA